MTLTKKEFLAAVKLCSDVAVQRGLPNMRVRAAGAGKGVNGGSKHNKKNGNVAAASKPGFRKAPNSNAANAASPESSTSSVSSNSPYFSKYYLGIMGANNNNNNSSHGRKNNKQLTKEKSEGHSKQMNDAMVRPTTTRLQRPTHASLDLPHIHVKSQDLNKPQHVISRYRSPSHLMN